MLRTVPASEPWVPTGEREGDTVLCWHRVRGFTCARPAYTRCRGHSVSPPVSASRCTCWLPQRSRGEACWSAVHGEQRLTGAEARGGGRGARGGAEADGGGAEAREGGGQRRTRGAEAHRDRCGERCALTASWGREGPWVFLLPGVPMCTYNAHGSLGVFLTTA